MEPQYTPQPYERNRRADRYRQQQEQPPVQSAPQPTQQAPRPMTAAQPAPQRVTPVQPVHYAGQQQPIRQIQRVQPVQQAQRPMQPVQRMQQPMPTERRSAYRDHMLESPQTAAAQKAALRDEPLPKWLIASILLTILLALGCFAGRMLMDSYLYKQQQARDAAYRQVLEAHPVQFTDLIQRYAMEYNLQPGFVTAIILNESSFNTHAESKVGARGLMQLMPDTATWIAHKLGEDRTYNVEQLWTAETNIRYGCWYLNYLSKQFGGDAVTVASAYHTGQGEVSSWLNNRTYAPDGRALSLTGMPDGPTKIYAGRVTRDYAIYDALYFHVFNAQAE